MLNPRQRRALRARQEAAELIGDYGLQRTAALLEVHQTTVGRWLDGTVMPPAAALIALRAAVKGQLPGMEQVRYWEGWRFAKDGNLYSPEGRCYHPGDLLAQQYERAQIKALQVRLREVEEKLAKATVGGAPGAANDGDLSVKSA